MRALAAYEAGICECGFHTDITSDRSNFFTFEDARCNVCKEAARWSRVQAADDEADEKRAGDNAPPTRIKQSDGRRTYIKRIPDPRE